jgi:fucose 4-O-acetylase-like acetyltransferase
MSRLDELAAATPATRDRFMDFLRAASIVAVVFGHWFISVIIWDQGVIRTVSAVGLSSGLWLGTWAFQVMPIFFFVGGFSNLVTYDSYRRRGESTGAFVWSRVSRLLRPSLVFLGVWAVVQVGLHLADVGAPTAPRLWGSTTLLRGMRPPGATLPFGPLWFLGVYLLVIVMSPVLIALHRRFGWWVPGAMIVGTIVADVVGFGTGEWGWRWFNVAFVLLLPHQLGFFYADGRLQRFPKRVFWTMALGGLAILVLLTTPLVFRAFGDAALRWFPGIGYYPKSLLGTDVELVSNAYPPTVPFMVQAIWSIGAVMLLRPILSRWLMRPGPWKVTIYLNSVIMTLFLWHMTAFLLAILLLWPFGLGHQTDTTAIWWLERVVWEVVPAAILFGLVAIFGRFERPRSRELPGAVSSVRPVAAS